MELCSKITGMTPVEGAYLVHTNCADIKVCFVTDEIVRVRASFDKELAEDAALTGRHVNDREDGLVLAPFKLRQIDEARIDARFGRPHAPPGERLAAVDGDGNDDGLFALLRLRNVAEAEGVARPADAERRAGLERLRLVGTQPPRSIRSVRPYVSP